MYRGVAANGLRVWRTARLHGWRSTVRYLAWRLRDRVRPDWEPWLNPYVPDGGRVALDVGANRGQWTGKLARRFDRVYALEPHPEAAAALARRTNGAAHVLPVAAWRECAVLPLRLYPDTMLCSLTLHELAGTLGKPSGELQVVGVPLDALQLTHVDFIKIDVEGAELDVLAGARRLLMEHHPAVMVEAHGALLRRGVEAALRAAHYRDLLVVHYPFYTPRDPLYGSRVWIVGSA